jgi:hypothetical protein
MALVNCPECGREISSNAISCPQCGNPMYQAQPIAPPRQSNGTFCRACNAYVTPVVTSVGGGSCSFGKRETWKCPTCTSVLHRSGCFVASATYGDEDFVEVQFLRAFRDKILSRYKLGRFFVWAYYYLGPSAAHIVERVPILKRIARRILDRVVVAIERRTSLRRSAFRSVTHPPDGDAPNNSVQRTRLTPRR